MRSLQPSFASGEISPLLGARVDLARYATGLRYLKNFIVLPQGGVTRRPGMTRVDSAHKTTGESCPVRMIPFVYNSEDAMIIELTDKYMRIRQPSTGQIKYRRTTDYKEADLAGIKYVQSGNTIFLTHRNYPIMKLYRGGSLEDWSFEVLEYKMGPWQTDSKNDGIRLQVHKGEGDSYRITTENETDYFDAGMVGTLIKLDYMTKTRDISGELQDETGWRVSKRVEVGAEWYLKTYDWWIGEIRLEKSYDNGDNWNTVRNYKREDPDHEGQLEISGSEQERNVLYRVQAMTSDGRLHYVFTATGYSKTNIFELTDFVSGSEVLGNWVKEDDEVRNSPELGTYTTDWKLGAWGGKFGHPGAICFYQDRLVLAGSHEQTQTIWMSKTGDYWNFGISDPIRDDDAINVTLCSGDKDGIHSLTALGDIIVFTRSDEWKIKGAGDNGAITPGAVVAHRQTDIGSSGIQPVMVGGGVLFVQTHGTQADILGYSLDIDGYSGNDISVVSHHLFQWLTAPGAALGGRRIKKMVYQQVPDSIVWFVLEDGSAVTCTFQPQQQVCAWARQETDGVIGDIAVVPGDGYDELWLAVRRDGVWGIEKMAERAREALFTDAGRTYESALTTLRVNYDIGRGAVLSNSKLLARLMIFAVRSRSAWVSPAGERFRRTGIEWDYSADVSGEDIMLNSGFGLDGGVEVWTEGTDSLTILALSPAIAPGGG